MIKSKRRKSWIVFPTHAGVISIYTLDRSYSGCAEGGASEIQYRVRHDTKGD